MFQLLSLIHEWYFMNKTLWAILPSGDEYLEDTYTFAVIFFFVVGEGGSSHSGVLRNHWYFYVCTIFFSSHMMGGGFLWYIYTCIVEKNKFFFYFLLCQEYWSGPIFWYVDARIYEIWKLKKKNFNDSMSPTLKIHAHLKTM